MPCTSASFYIKQDNLDYISDQVKGRARYNKSNWLDDLVDHLRSKSEGKADPQKAKKAKRKIEPVPDNFDEQFDKLWWAIGRNGSKCKAEDNY